MINEELSTTGGEEDQIPSENPVEEAKPLDSSVALQSAALAGGGLASKRRWYTVRTYSGHERKVKEHIDREIEKHGIAEKIAQVYIPYEKFVEVKDGKKTSRTKNAFPGYILVEALLDKQTKSVILETPSVVGFLGVKDEPQALRPDEVKRIMEPDQDADKRSSIKSPFEIGGSVKVTDGPFATLTGTVQEVNTEKMKVKVLLSFFGRSTPTEFDFSQVKPVVN
ncbi:MAG: transcription termination/antitermination protein NusG [Chloroherpetonaceae bacterium]|nr:transcription termination/antitermination protein NusG [Chloroherpetonaceae bacterium]